MEDSYFKSQINYKASSVGQDLFWSYLCVFIMVGIAYPLFMFNFTTGMTEFFIKVVLFVICGIFVYKIINHLAKG